VVVIVVVVLLRLVLVTRDPLMNLLPASGVDAMD